MQIIKWTKQYTTNDRTCLVKTRDVQKTLFILASECREFRAFRARNSLSTRVGPSGQSLPKWAVRAASAFPLIAPEDQTSRHVRKVPNRCAIARGGERASCQHGERSGDHR